MTTQAKSRSYMTYIHFIIMCAIMIVFRIIPPFLSMTPEGMSVLGVFIGWIYGICFSDMFIACLLAFVGISLTGIQPITEYYVGGFASETAVILIFSMIFIGGLVDKFDLTNLLLQKMFTIKVFYGKPWLFSISFLILSYIVCTFTNPYVMILFVYQIIISISKQLGYKPYSAWPSFMIIVSTLLASISIINMPYKSTSLLFFGIFSNAMNGQTISWGSYIVWINLMAILCTIFSALLFRIIFRPDISALASLDASFFCEVKGATKEQKIALVLMALFIIVLLSYGFIPEGTALKPIVTSIGLAGLEMLILVITLLIKVDGKPLISFNEMAKAGMQWNAYMLVVFALPLMTLMTNESTGITASIMSVLTPLLQGHSPFMFVVIIIVIATILTNFFNNMVVIMILTPILCGYAMQIDINAPLLLTMLITCGYLAIVLPAGSPLTAIMFGHRDWVNMKVGIVYGGIGLVAFVSLMLVVGYPLGNIIF